MSGQHAGRLERRWSAGRWGRMHARVSRGARPEAGQPVVLVHGLSVSSRYFVPLAQRLAVHYPVYAPDLPGFGRSDKPPRALDIVELSEALWAWMQSQSLRQAALLGNSAGCQIIAELAVQQPEAVTQAVLVGLTPDPSRRTALEYTARLLLDGTREPLRLLAIALKDYFRAGLRRSLQTTHYVLADRVEERLPAMHMPVLVVRGARDPLVPQDWAEAATRLLPQGQLSVLPGHAHGVHYTAAGRMARLVRAFLEGQREALPQRVSKQA